MTKKELIAHMSMEANLTKTDAGRLLQGFMETITERLARGEKINLIGFGTFSVADRAARKCCNPQTGERMVIPARTVAKFKPGKKLTEAVK
ncbi:MAG TPA: HU family DNA-binding protein [Desulfobulbaceae bacterium]|nr:HU family DNA-binding protein [Desulfobulbaceae bacterium]